MIIISILVAIFMPEGWKGNLNPKALSNSPDTIVLPESEQTKESNEIESTSKKTDIEIKNEGEVPVNHYFNFNLQGLIINEYRKGIPGLTVILRNLSENKTFTLKTDDRGYFLTRFRTLNREIVFEMIVKKDPNDIILSETTTFKTGKTITRIIK